MSELGSAPDLAPKPELSAFRRYLLGLLGATPTEPVSPEHPDDCNPEFVPEEYETGALEE